MFFLIMGKLLEGVALEEFSRVMSPFKFSRLLKIHLSWVA
jgi:hypothetical protein